MNGVQSKDDLQLPQGWQRGPTRPPRSRLKAILWLVLIVALVGVIAWVIFRPQPEQHARGGRFGANGPVPVVAAPVEKGDVPITLNALGAVTSLATVTVKTQIAGQLTQIAFQEGQIVHAGDFLAQVDPRPYELSLAQNQGQLEHDQALLKEAQVDLNRYKTLASQDSIARQQVDTQAALVQQYQGTVATDQAQVNTAKLNLVYCHITAPVTGRVGLRQVDQGNYVQTSDTNGIVVITQLQPISVLFTLPEDNLPAVMKRLHDGASLQVVTYDRSQSTKLATGKLLTVDNQIDSTTGTVKLRAQFDNQDDQLFPNQFVNTELLVDMLHDSAVIPTAAIQRGAPGTFVYVVKPDNTVTVRPIKLGPIAGERAAVTSGLDQGERVVVDGADKLREGAQVTLPTANGAAAAPAAGQGDAAGQGAAPHGNGEHRHRKDQ